LRIINTFFEIAAKSRRSSLHGDYYSEETDCLKE